MPCYSLVDTSPFLNILLVFDCGSALGCLGELRDLPLPRLHVVSEVDVNLQQLGLERVVSRAQQVDGLHAGLDGPHVIFLQCLVERVARC